MIAAVAFCPQAPVLVPDLAQGAAPELAELRAACSVAIRRIAAPGRQLVVLGGGERNAGYGPAARGSFAGFGLDLVVPLGSDEPGDVSLPPSLTVGAWLLRDALGANCGAVAYSIAEPFETDDHWDGRHGADIGVLVMGDGSARRSLKAPGYFDDRAAAYDNTVIAALRSGDSRALAALDPAPGVELLAAGVAAWRRAGGLLRGGRWQAELLCNQAPYGVSYSVASWRARE